MARPASSWGIAGIDDWRPTGGTMPNWAEQVTAIATAIGAIGLMSAIGAVIYAGQQVREARIGRQAEIASDFFRRWSEEPMIQTRRLVATFATKEQLRDAFLAHIAANDVEAFILYRELDYFEQLGALEAHGGFDFELIRALLGRRLIDRWTMWQPSIEAIGGSAVYPMYEQLVRKMEAATAADPRA
jgi:hypothetical protein